MSESSVRRFFEIGTAEVIEDHDYPQPLEYPCNCTRCRNVTDDRETYHDGEVTWWRCIFCARHFELEDTEPVLADECPYVDGDTQACVRCAEGWKQCCARESVPSDAVENNEQPAPPGALSVA